MPAAPRPRLRPRPHLRSRGPRQWPSVALLGMLLCTVVFAAGCGSGGSLASNAPGSSGAARRGSGPVNVLYAGSLVDLMEKQIGPTFDKATGYTFTGISAGSNALATQIKGGVHAGDVFISAAPAVNDSLTGAANGDWVSWYATFASSPVVIGYNPNSKFANDLKTRPWYQVVLEPGFRLGSTDPAANPKGKLAQQGMLTAAQQQHLPALAALANDPSINYPEEGLVARLQSGQVDAGFFFTAEATVAHIPTVPIPGQETLKAVYTITVLNRAAHTSGAEAFVQNLLGADGLAVLKQDGFDVTTPPTVTGSGVPSRLAAGVLHG